MGRLISLIVLISLAAPSAARGDAAAPAERDPVTVTREVERALGHSHQRTLPGFDPDDAAAGGDRARSRADRERDDARRNDPRLDPRTGRHRERGDRTSGSDGQVPTGPLSTLASFLLWGLAIAAGVVLAVGVYGQVSGYAGEDKPDAPARRDDAQLAAVIERPRDDADELAAHGRFADAIHTLLLRTLHELASQHLIRVTASMTSREILAKVALIGDARDGLAGLIVAVEQTWFGDDVPQVADYQRCRAQFDRFAAAYRRGAGSQA